MNASVKSNLPPLKLGVTGGVGSGKSVVCDYFAYKGFTVISADDLARRAVMPGTSAYENIVNYFGSQVLFNGGKLDRKKLRGIITHDPEKKNILENFIHPEVFKLMAAEFTAAAERKEPLVVVEVPLLFEAGLKDLFDFTLLVCAGEKIRIKRMMNRDQVTYEDAKALQGIQMPEEEKIKQSDFIIDNNGTKEELSVSMDQFYQTFINRLKIAGKQKR